MLSPRALQRVLFLHGCPAGAFIWDEVAGQLGDDIRCVAPGRSTTAAAEANVDRPCTAPGHALAIHSLVLAPELITVRLPTTIPRGDADVELPASLHEGMDDFVSPLEVLRVPGGASHWIVHERPVLVAATITSLLKRRRTDP